MQSHTTFRQIVNSSFPINGLSFLLASSDVGKINNSINKEASIPIKILTLENPTSFPLWSGATCNLDFCLKIAFSRETSVTNSSPQGLFLPIECVCVRLTLFLLLYNFLFACSDICLPHPPH